MNEADAHARYAVQLEALADDSALLHAVNAAAAARAWWPLHTAWTRRAGRFAPDAAPYCTLSYESASKPQQFCTVELHEVQPPEADWFICMPLGVLGWLRVARFPHDPEIATLPEVWRRLSAEREVEVIRYRMGSRCTLRVLTRNGQRAFVKVFPDARGADVHAAGLALWAASQRGELDFAVAQPLHWDDELRCLWQGVAPGAPGQAQLLVPEGATIGARLGRALASLSVAAVDLPERYDAAWQLKRTRRALHEVALRANSLAPVAHGLAARFERLHSALPPRTTCPIHGAPHPQQWLVSEQGCALVDFDRCGHGDPELDVATFLAEVDFERRERYPVDAINAAFVAGFRSHAELDDERLALYRAHKHISKALRFLRGVRTEAKARAQQVLDSVNGALIRLSTISISMITLFSNLLEDILFVV